MTFVRTFFVVMGVLFASLSASVAATSPAIAPDVAEAWNGGEIDWRDIRSGIREATVNKKTVIMVFHAPWCQSCKKYRSVFRDARIVTESKKFVMILIDADADKMSNGAFSPDGTYVPRTIFLNSDGDVLDKYVSKDPKYPHSLDINSPEELLSLMQRAAGDLAPAPPPAGQGRT